MDADLASLDDARLAQVRASLDALLAARGLEREATPASRRWSFMIRSEASQVTDADRQAVQAWAAEHREITTIRVGPMADWRGA